MCVIKVGMEWLRMRSMGNVGIFLWAIDFMLRQ